MNDDAAMVLGLWVAVALLLGHSWVPALVAGLGGSRYDSGGSEDPSLVVADTPEARFWQDQMTALGYEPVGVGWMRINFHGPFWRYNTQLRVFHSRARQAFAFIQKQPRPFDVWWLTVFATCYQDGSLLLTNNGEDVPAGEGEYVLQGMSGTDLTALQALHTSTDERLRREGRKPDRDGGLDTLLRTTKQHAGPQARTLAMRLGQTYLASHAMIHIFLSVPPAYLMGFNHMALPLANLVLGSMLALSEFASRRRAGAAMRSEIRAAAGRTASGAA